MSKNTPTAQSGFQSETDLQTALISIVQREDIDPDKVEKFLDIHFRIRNDRAEEAFNKAMVLFQKSCPIITKNKKIKDRNGKERSSYAPLDELVHQIKGLLVENGLSYSFDTQNISEALSNMIVTIRHIDGHKENFNYPYEPMDEGGLMNNQQRRKSALSYAKRAALENALGIVTQGEDDDAQRAVDAEITDNQIEEVCKLIEVTNADEEKLLAYIGVKEIADMSQFDARKAIHALKQKRIANVSRN